MTFQKRERLKQTAVYASQCENGLRNPYTGDVVKERLYNQRALLLLEDGSIVKSERYREYNPRTGRLQEPVTGESLSSVHTTEFGRVSKQKVEKIFHKPNHNMITSLRAAELVPQILSYYSKVNNPNIKRLQDLIDENLIERLQHMMLFSVIGRKDETGWADKNDLARKEYETYRTRAARLYYDYAMKNLMKTYMASDDPQYKDKINPDALYENINGYFRYDSY